MSVQGITAKGRSATESRFTETISFVRVENVDDVNGIPKPTDVPVHTDVPGQVKSASQVVSDRESGAQLVAVQQRIVKVAVGSTPDVQTGDFAVVTASTVDDGLVGRRFRVTGIADSGQVTAWRYPVSEAS